MRTIGGLARRLNHRGNLVSPSAPLGRPPSLMLHLGWQRPRERLYLRQSSRPGRRCWPSKVSSRMFSLDDRPYTLCDRISRRELMRIGGLNLLGLSLPALLAAQARAAPPAQRRPDLRPGQEHHLPLAARRAAAARDVRPQARRAAGDPRRRSSRSRPTCRASSSASCCRAPPRIADKLAVVRSMSTDDNTHDTSGYWVLTGYKYPGGQRREIKPSDWPYFGSVVKMLKPSERLPALSSVWIPDIMRLNDNVRPAGQTGRLPGRAVGPRPLRRRSLGRELPGRRLGLQSDISPLRLRKPAVAVRAGRPAPGRSRARRARFATSTTFARPPSAC